MAQGRRRGKKYPPVMTDPDCRYQLIPNGHPRFLTKAARDKVLQANLDTASRYGFVAAPQASVRSAQARSMQQLQLQQQGSVEVSIDENDLQDSLVASGTSLRDGNATAQETRRKRRAVLRNPECGAAVLLRSSLMLPEPDFFEGGGRRVVTLRVRSMPGGGRRKRRDGGRSIEDEFDAAKRVLPEFSEGDRVVGVWYEDASSEDDESDEDGEDDEGSSDDDSGDNNSSSDEGRRRKRRKKLREQVFQVLDVCWGVQAYVNQCLGGMYGGRGVTSSSAANNCFLVCREVG